MTEEMKKEGSNMCGCCGCGSTGMGGMYGFRRHMIIRKVLMLVVIIMAFAVGMQIGELKGELRGSYGRGGMMRGYGEYGGNDNNYGYRMMGNFNKGVALPLSPAPTTPTPPVKQ